MEATPESVAPRILSRPEHIISRKNIDPDALKVLYRLKNNGFVAYLVGGGVRDLLLERQPKDFDIGTSAHPQQVRKLFRNCFIVGRRFRLAHVRFGRKVVEVSTFRRAAEPLEGDTLIHRDNTFGSPEEDAFRRDFTVNALFYDIATFSVIDWVGGLEDLKARVIRTIGDPEVRFREDPVRMLRAVALAARLEFRIDRDTAEAVRHLRGEIVRSSPARILEEFYKILRQGRSRRTLEMLHEHGLLAYLLPEADRAIAKGGEALLGSLGRLDDYRLAGLATPDQLTNPLLLGSLLVPLGVPLRRAAAAAPSPRPGRGEPAEAERAGEAEAEDAEPARDDVAAEAAELGELEDDPEGPGEAVPLALPFARRDIERLRLVLLAQRRLRERHGPSSARRAMVARSYFEDALRWLEVHGGEEGLSLAAEWRGLELGPVDEPAGDAEGPHLPPEGATARSAGNRRRRRRRRRRRPSEPAPTA
ncbi:MAG TPA: polynucleotide adenylyltransferase PcnB [Vicinamibacteria bacterium]